MTIIFLYGHAPYHWFNAIALKLSIALQVIIIMYMNKFRLNILYILFALQLLPMSGKSQALQYSYDASGNRISKTLITVMSQAPEPPSDMPNEKFHTVQTRNNLTKGLIDIKIEDFNLNSNYRISVYTTDGIDVTSVVPNSELTTIDLSNLRRGVYVLAVSIDDHIQTFKITKK